MNRAALEKPFQADLVKTRKTETGKALAFVGAVHYIRRLNEAFESEWTWRVLSHEVHGGQVVVHGVLEAKGQAKHAFGGWAISINKETGEVISTADDIKAASSDALKKAASLFGIGLDLYLNDDESGRGNPSTPAKAEPTYSNGGRGAPTDRNRLTAKQLKAIYAIARAKGIADAQLRQTTIKRFGSPAEFLSMTNASSFIDELKAG
jgi:hypothetical protein